MSNDLAIVVSKCTPILYTLNYEYALKAFRDSLADNGFDLEDEDAIRANEDYYIELVQMDRLNSIVRTSYETPLEFQADNNVILITARDTQKGDVLEIEERDLQDLSCMQKGEHYKHFQVIYNDIPELDDRSSYTEDDGREYRILELIDKERDILFYINFTFNPDFENTSFKILEDGVDISFIKPEPKEPPKPVEKPKTPQQIAIESVKKELDALEMEGQLRNVCDVDIPKEDYMKVVNILKTSKFSLYDIQEVAFPLCVKHRVDQKSFWQECQKLAGNWK